MSTNRAFQTYSPRVRRLTYDALQQDYGCRDIVGVKQYASLPFTRVCVASHDAESEVFNRSPLVAYAYGPLTTGNPPPWSTRWAAWVAKSGIRVAKAGKITLPNETSGAPSAMWANFKDTATKISIGFTPAGQIGIALQVGGSIRVRWFTSNQGNYAEASFAGESPVLFGNATLNRSVKASDGDLVLYYLRPAVPRAIFARFQRENFATEYTVNQNIQAEIKNLIGAEAIVWRQFLYAQDSLGRDLTLRTDEYIPYANTDKGKLSVGLTSGTYRTSAIPASFAAGLHKSTLAIGLESGIYATVIVDAGILSDDKQSLTVGLESGEYA